MWHHSNGHTISYEVKPEKIDGNIGNETGIISFPWIHCTFKSRFHTAVVCQYKICG